MTTSRSRRSVAFLIVAGLAVPLVSASVLAWSFSDRLDRIDAVPVAIVNDDVIVSDPTPMAAGRAISAALTHPDEGDENLDWELTTADAAASGLADGTYYSVLTIPADFSADVVSVGTDSPQQAALGLETNDAASATASLVSQQVVAAATSTLGNQVTEAYLDNVYSGFNSISDSMTTAADGAGDLVDGSSSLAEGADSVADGSASLSSGLDELLSGANSLADGTGPLVDGAKSLSDGTGDLKKGTKELASGAGKLAESGDVIESSTATLSTGASDLSTGASSVATGAGDVSTGTDTLATSLATLSQSCAKASPSATFCSNLATAASAAATLETAAGQVATGATTVSDSAASLSSGATTLATATTQLSDGIATLSTSASDLNAGAKSVDAGTDSLLSGAKELDSGAQSLATAAQDAATGAVTLDEGAQDLAAGSHDLNDGAVTLEDGLVEGAESVPTYSDDEASELSSVVSEPIDMTTSSETGSSGWSTAAIAASVLWLAAVFSLFVRGNRSRLTAPVSTARLVAQVMLPRIALAVGQGLVTFFALRALQGSIEWAAPLAALSALAAVTFTLIASALHRLMPRVGMAIYLVFFVAQIAAIGNILPLETAPPIIQSVNGLLPFTAFINGASQLAGGGNLFSMFSIIAVLVVWSLAALAAIVSVQRSERRLDPTVPTLVVA